ncbi:MAG: type IV pilus secretin PilQ [Nitrospirae bacterium]|nr:type IV pilus secretin PilQ [Nitrospirota bacterium]
MKRLKLLKRGIVPILAVLLLLGSLAVCAAEQDAAATIKGIDVTDDNTIIVRSDSPLKFKLMPLDPFRAEVELSNVSLGEFKDRVVVNKGFIAEITPVQVESPSLSARLSIVFSSPVQIVPVTSGNDLVLNISGTAEKSAYKKIKASAIPAEPKDGIANLVTDIIINKTDDGAELILKGNGLLPDPEVFEIDGKVMLDIPGIGVKAEIPADMIAPVKSIRHSTETDKSRFTITIDRIQDKDIFVLDDEIVIDLYVLPRSKKIAADKGKAAGGFEDQQVKPGAVVSLDFQDADVVAILRLLGDVSGYNIVVHPDVKGKITMKLMNVPWEQALNILMKTFNLEKAVEGNILRIATAKAFQDEKKSVAAIRDATAVAEDVVTKIFIVNFANVEKTRDIIEKGKILSPRGNISVDTRTRSIIVKDTPSRLAEVDSLIKSLDKQTPQIMIEARLVEVNTTMAKELGVQWGGWLAPRWGSNSYSASGSGSGSISGMQPASSFPSSDARSNLPGTYPAISAGTSSANPIGAMTFGFLNASQTINLALRISALETTGKGKILSNPRIMTVDNEQAIIKHGAQIPVTTRNSDGTYTTTYKDANIKLTVTPQSVPDGSVFLKVEITKDEPDFSRKDSFDNPVIYSRQASTQVLVKNGETLVIGGIVKSLENESESGVPLLSKIPILGALFKNNVKSTESEELMIFITPRLQ